MREVPHSSSSSTRRPTDADAHRLTHPSSQPTSHPPSHADVEQHLSRAVEALKSLQKHDGHWCAELEGDSILQSEYLLMKWILGQESQPLADGRGPETLRRILAYLRSQQREDGGWGQYPGSKPDVSACVKAYFALKLFGDSPDAPHMKKARALIRHLGGAERCNSFTNFYLAALGQISWNAVPAIPPEIVFLPKWFYFHLDKVSAWSRTMILPLAIVATKRPTRELPATLGIGELFVDHDARHMLKPTNEAPARWKRFFLAVDRLLKKVHDAGGTPLRGAAIDRAFDWIAARAGQDGAARTDGVGAIFPPMVYWQIVLHALGYERSHPLVQRAERELDAFFVELGAGPDAPIRIQPCFSPVWDTGIALYALADCGFTMEDEVAARAASWLVARECRFAGDWQANVDGAVAPSGWYFEYANSHYPDSDDSAMVAMALARVARRGQPGDARVADAVAAAERGVRWILAMQNNDGGWAAFDRSRDRRVLDYVPFADHNAMQDPSCPDITGRVLECLAWHGFTKEHPSVRAALDFIRARQEPEGCFFGRWGVNYIYGTWQAVIGPIRCGVPRDEEWIQRAGRWIKSIQKPDGSFGESADTYEDPSLKGQGPSTASQTAWAAMVLQEAFGADDPDLQRAIGWLCRTQLDTLAAADPLTNPDGDPAGSWRETEYTGTGFPKVFYLRYHLYRLYFPTMAIGRYLDAHGRGLAGKRLIDRGERTALFA
jgi:squalene-hopene/tetraprenyl-beta-curcumene cyclase